MRSLFSKIIFAGLLALVAGNAYSAGSNVNGVIRGTVVDSDSVPVAGATVTATNPSNGLSRTVTSGADGSYTLNVPSGVYDISTSKEGATSSSVTDVAVSLGSTANISLVVGTKGETIEEVTVMGQAVNVNTDVASTGLNISLGDIELLPVARNIESVALLAPGTVGGDVAFGEEKTLVAFGGSSVAENVYYIDGLNVTNFRNGLGGSSVPFEFYQDFQIKTGGYSAEFGRSTGGVINAVTKRGTNEWEYGLVSYYEPESLRSNSPDTFYADGRLYDHNSDNERQSWVTDFYLGGPILKDKLFFYALYETSDTEEEFTSLDSIVGDSADRNLRSIDDDFYGLNLFWNINDQHSLSLTHFTDERSRVTETFNGYSVSGNSGGISAGTGFENRGGDNTVLRWDGQLTDNFRMSALVGKNEYNLTDTNTVSDDCPNVVNFTSSLALPFIASCSGDFVNVTVGGDEREAIRLDAEWSLGDHLVRFGLDNETNSSANVENYAANGHYYAYFDGVAGGQLPNGFTLTSDQIYVRDRVRTVGGSFETEANAFYIEDIWEVNDSLTLSLGLRSESFNNMNPNGESFIKLDNQIAPRLGLEFDTSGGSGSSVFYANWGRYHLPIANNTNARLSGNESDQRTYHLFDGLIDPVTNAPVSVGADGVPTTTQFGDVQVFADGSVPDVLELVDQTIDPMFQDEIILGYRMELNDDWTVGVKYTKRELSSTIDDITVLDTGHYVLTNPGTDLVYFDDFNGDGVNERIELSAAELGYPEATRDFTSVEFEADRAFDGKWSMNASYTYSDSKGNTEGLVKSDNGQDDAGITTDFDFPSLQDGSFGRLPNDREHALKMRGNYQLTDNLVLGGTAVYSTGRPINRFGVGHPNSPPDYGATYYTLNAATGEFAFNPRGSAGETESTLRLDLRAVYSMEFAGADVQFSLDVFNLLDADEGIEVEERLERGAAGVPDDRYGLITSYQRPRSFRLGAAFRF